MKPSVFFAVFLIVMALAPAPATRAGDPAASSGPIVIRGAEQSDPVVPSVFNGDLRNLPRAPVLSPGEPAIEIPRRTYPRAGSETPPEGAPPAQTDPLLAIQENAPGPTTRAFTTPIYSFDGIGATGVLPPDTVGDVGPNHYIQMVNGAGGGVFTIHDKSGSGTPIVGATNLDSLWTGGGACASGFGDGIVLWDSLADRWLLAEFAQSGNHLCVYISQTDDPVLGGWYGYDFSVPQFPDYPKYAAWPDAYYVSTNESSPAAYALDRVKMLSGLPATFQRFTAPDLSGFSFQSLTPGDLDGTAPPPAGSTATFMRHRDKEAHGGATDTLELFQFHVDWTTPANSTFLGPTSITVSNFDSSLCGFVSFACFPQPGTLQTLDPLREVIMWRLQYRNFGSHESLVGNFVVDVDGTNHGGIRWFELRKVGAGSWSLFQEGTYAPDAAHRWMGSVAMNGSGDIALGYSVSSGSVFPSIRYTGRLAGDSAGTMPQGEGTLVAGTGSQTSTSNRWGDYSALSVDPSDDCTFWYTNEYYSTTSPAGWKTRIGAFSIDCPTADLVIAKQDSPDPVIAGTNLTYTVRVDNNGPDDATGVTLTDDLPGSVDFVSATPDQGTCGESAGVVTCDLGDIANAAPPVFVDIVVTPNIPGLITNRASVAGDQFDTDPANNKAQENTTVDAETDLSITKTDDPDPAFRDANLTYTVTVTNNGPSHATGVVMTDTLPANLTLVSAVSGQGSCGAPQITCNIGNISSGSSVDITIVVIPTVEGPYSNTASVTGNETDPVPGNNSDTQNTTVDAVSDLSVTKTDSPDPVVAGNNLTYRVTVTNNGPSIATGVTMSDPLPAGPTFVSAIPDQGSCGEAAGTVTCNLGSINIGQDAIVQIVMTPQTAGSLSNTASVSGTESDPVPGNDSDTEATGVTGISVSPPAGDFGGVAVGTSSSPIMFTITNSGTTSLDVTSVGTVDPEFPKSNDLCSGQTLVASGSCTVNASFSPVTPGPKNANLTVISTDPIRPTLNVPLSGTQNHSLTVSKSGAGGGTVTSSPSGINCGANCQASYPYGTNVTLNPAPDSDSVFTGWSGNADCSDGQVTVDGDKACTANFDVKTYDVTIALTGSGTGTVTSNPVGIDCGSDCAEGYPVGTLVKLKAAPDAESVLTRWSGDCSGSDIILPVTVDSNTSCTAVFDKIQYTLAVTKTGNGSGIVTSDVPGVDCGTDCSEDYTIGTQVKLTADPDTGSIFSGWSGSGDCTDGLVLLDGIKNCIAVFDRDGDLDGSGRIDGFDLGTLGLAFGSGPGDPNWNPGVDFNGDGLIDQADYDILKGNFGKSN